MKKPVNANPNNQKEKELLLQSNQHRNEDQMNKILPAGGIKRPTPSISSSESTKSLEITHQNSNTEITPASEESKQTTYSEAFPEIGQGQYSEFKSPLKYNNDKRNQPNIIGMESFTQSPVGKNQIQLKSNQNKKDKRKITQMAKRIKMTDAPTLEETRAQLEQVNIHLKESQYELPISLDIISQFLTDTFGNSDIYPIATKYTDNFSNLIDTLQQIHERMEQNNLRSRIKRIIKKFVNNESQTSGNDEETSSDER